jgi:hypothetical protein
LHCKSRFEVEQDEFTVSCEFPKLSLEIIRKELTFGSYQRFHSPSYLAEHMSENLTLYRQNTQTGAKQQACDRHICNFISLVWTYYCIAQQLVIMRTTKCVCRGGFEDDNETELDQFYFYRDENNNLTNTFSHASKCPGCSKTMIQHLGQFLSTPALLFFDMNYSDKMVKVNCYEVPVSHGSLQGNISDL